MPRTFTLVSGNARMSEAHTWLASDTLTASILWETDAAGSWPTLEPVTLRELILVTQLRILCPALGAPRTLQDSAERAPVSHLWLKDHFERLGSKGILGP
jgi:hypothetical protein